MIDKTLTYAVVGASNNPEKYGYKVLKDLKNAGYKAIPINPHEDEILGLKSYGTLAESPVKIDVVIFVVPPGVTEEVLKSVKKLGIKQVWMQPGSESEKAIEFCKQNGINHTANACIMIERTKD
ncbi:CoA-binding protein [bacterium]|nr:CoA-binding protein [bacterium]